jgi:CIC family chloride channel protein
MESGVECGNVCRGNKAEADILLDDVAAKLRWYNLAMTLHQADQPDDARIPATLLQAGALRFWQAVLWTGIGAGVSAIVLTRLLESVQHLVWAGSGTHILDAAAHAGVWRHILALLGAGVVVGIGQFALSQLSSGNGIDINSAIWFSAGRLPVLRTLGSALLSVIVVGMGASLGREGAPKQAGAVFANLISDRARLSDEQRRLLVACGAGAGMAAAYGVPLGGALFALEVLRGMLALRLVLPALLASLVATALSWLVLPNRPTYQLPVFSSSASALALALLIGPLAGLVSVGYVRTVAWADHNKPTGWQRFIAPVLALGLLGVLSIRFPQLLGNGRDLSQLLFTGGITSVGLLFMLLILKPAAILLCLGSGTPGGLFTPSLTFGALLGGIIGYVGAHLGSGVPPGLCALLGAGALLAATTQGPISTVVLMIELTGQDRAFIAPLLLAIIAATLVSRMIEPRSIYDARLSDKEVLARLAAREPSPL